MSHDRHRKPTTSSSPPVSTEPVQRRGRPGGGNRASQVYAGVVPSEETKARWAERRSGLVQQLPSMTFATAGAMLRP